jgi:glutamate dehydrogenase (NADP+)
MTTMRVDEDLARFLGGFTRRNPHQPEFHQAVAEVAGSVLPLLRERPGYHHARVLERLTEPDRIVVFRVCWEDDQGRIRVNRGYRVQHSNAVGPYKGGLRFTPAVNLSILKALAFEQTFKNSLTGLSMGGAKGGADFNPRGRSDREVMRFCQSYMTELYRHIGPDADVPAGDIGVGPREIGFLFGQHKRISGEFSGALTGKGIPWGGSQIRAEATGYGIVYFLDHMLRRHQRALDRMRVAISGAGNVALYAAEKVITQGGIVVTLSDTSGTLEADQGLTLTQLDRIKHGKFAERRSLADLHRELGCRFHAGQRPWHVRCDIALPCAVQNELDGEDARRLLDAGCTVVVEGANLPCLPAAARRFQDAGILYAPAKAANAGGVAVSGLEMGQNRLYLSFGREDIDSRLRHIMEHVHDRCVEHGSLQGRTDYVRGANRAAFIRVAEAMTAFGVL